MKLAGEYVFDAGVPEVWDALFDPAVLAAVLPGCEKLDLVDGAYVGDLVVKVGPIQGKFSGKVDLSDKVEPTSYKMVVDGRGAQGFVKAIATIVLEPVGAGTRIKYDSDAQVGGKIASVGQRLIETSARAIVKQSLDGLNENIKIRAEAYRARATAAPDAAQPEQAAPTTTTSTSTTTTTEAAAPQLAIVTPPAAAPEAEKLEVAEVATPAPAKSEPSAPKPAAPVIAYKKADADKLAGAVAKEVTRALAPIIAVLLAVVAVVIYLLAR
jgi:carbon monoxide dehydrogenase subunit G